MKNKLVIFYSWSGNTRRLAETIAKQTDSKLLQLQPKHPYPENYNDILTQAKQEIQEKYRPDLLPHYKKIVQYKTLFLGTPNWYGKMAPPLAAFLYQTMPCDKTIIPFCTHGGGGAEQVADDIARYCIGCDILPILSVESNSTQMETQVQQWLVQTRQRLKELRNFSLG